MKIEVQIEPGCREPRVVIHTDRMTDEVSALLARLETGQDKPLVGFSEGTATVLAPETLLRVYVENGRTMAHTEQGTYALKGPLYEWEQRLDPRAAARQLPGSPYAAQIAVKNAQKRTTGSLRQAVAAFAAVDGNIKQGIYRDRDALLLAVLNTFEKKEEVNK